MVSGIIGACPHLVVAKGHIHAPVQAILGTRAQADCRFMRYCASGARLLIFERRSVEVAFSLMVRSVVISTNDCRSGQRSGACRQVSQSHRLIPLEVKAGQRHILSRGATLPGP